MDPPLAPSEDINPTHETMVVTVENDTSSKSPGKNHLMGKRVVAKRSYKAFKILDSQRHMIVDKDVFMDHLVGNTTRPSWVIWNITILPGFIFYNGYKPSKNL